MPVLIELPMADGFGHFGRHDAFDIEQASNEPFLNAVLGSPTRFHFLSRDKTFQAVEPDGNGGNRARYAVPTVSPAFQALHQAFAVHIPFSLGPDWVWYMIVHEVAEHVRQNSDRYASLFTDTPDAKQLIYVQSNSLHYNGLSDWQSSINLVRDPLAKKITPETMQLFLPKFSTSTPEDETALLVALMDTVSPYYDFKWGTDCGIPQIRLEGEAADWRLLFNSAVELSLKFTGLADYFNDLLGVLAVIVQTAEGKQSDVDFWRSIYKYGGGSGGPFVSGWFTAFFAFVQTRDGAVPKTEFDWNGHSGAGRGFTTNQFPSHISKVPFVWRYHGTEYQMAFAGGVLGVDYDNAFLVPRLGFAVVEV